MAAVPPKLTCRLSRKSCGQHAVPAEPYTSHRPEGCPGSPALSCCAPRCHSHASCAASGRVQRRSSAQGRGCGGEVGCRISHSHAFSAQVPHLYSPPYSFLLCHHCSLTSKTFFPGFSRCTSRIMAMIWSQRKPPPFPSPPPPHAPAILSSQGSPAAPAESWR